MLEKLRLEGRERECILNDFLDENNLKIEDIYVNEIEVPTKLFKSKKIILEIIKKTDIRDYIKSFIAKLSENFNCNIKTEIRESENVFTVMLISDNNPIIIGREGRNLNAIQLLLHQSLNVQTGFNIRVCVDASNYKDKRLKRIEREVKNIAREVSSTKIEVKLDPMNSYERRIVHTIVGDFHNLETESFGEGSNRHVVIRYKED